MPDSVFGPRAVGFVPSWSSFPLQYLSRFSSSIVDVLLTISIPSIWLKPNLLTAPHKEVTRLVACPHLSFGRWSGGPCCSSLDLKRLLIHLITYGVVKGPLGCLVYPGCRLSLRSAVFYSSSSPPLPQSTLASRYTDRVAWPSRVGERTFLAIF